MIKLYLVEPKTGKRLHLGRHFGYYGDYIVLLLDHDVKSTFPFRSYLMRDPKDPLGDDPMFNGRTYGNGRFILCEGEA
jgi:hypothetical protein